MSFVLVVFGRTDCASANTARLRVKEAVHGNCGTDSRTRFSSGDRNTVSRRMAATGRVKMTLRRTEAYAGTLADCYAPVIRSGEAPSPSRRSIPNEYARRST